MVLALGLIAAVSGVITFYLIKQKPSPSPTPQGKFYDYKGVRKHDFIKDRVMFYPYNYVNG